PPRPGRARLDGFERPFSVPRDGLRQALVEVDGGLELEELARLLDVGNAQLDVRVVERLEDELTGTTREQFDALRKVEDRHCRARVADVERLSDGLRPLEAEERPGHHVVDVAPRADLRPVAVNGQVASGERRLDERANGAAADLSRAVDVE